MATCYWSSRPSIAGPWRSCNRHGTGGTGHVNTHSQRGFLFKKIEVLSFCFSSFTVVCQVHQRKEGNLLQESGETFAKACAPP